MCWAPSFLWVGPGCLGHGFPVGSPSSCNSSYPPRVLLLAPCSPPALCLLLGSQFMPSGSALHQLILVPAGTRDNYCPTIARIASLCGEEGTIYSSSTSRTARYEFYQVRNRALVVAWDRNRTTRWNRCRPQVTFPGSTPRSKAASALEITVSAEIIDDQLLDGAATVLAITGCSKACLAELWPSRQTALDYLKEASWVASPKYWDGVSPWV